MVFLFLLLFGNYVHGMVICNLTLCVEFNGLIMFKFISHATEFYVLVLNKHCSGYNRVTLYFLALGNLNGDKLFENIMILHLKYLT